MTSIHVWPIGITPSNPAPTAEEAARNPLTLLRGIDSSGERNAQLAINEAVLFGTLDPSRDLGLPLPDGFNAPTPEQFGGWHSYFQARWMFLNAETVTWTETGGNTTQSMRHATFGTGDAASTFMLSQDGSRVLRVDMLQLTDIAALPLVDQQALAQLPAFATRFGDRLGVTPSSQHPDSTLARDALKDTIDGAKDLLQDMIADPGATLAGILDGTDAIGSNYALLGISQLEMLAERLDGMGIFAPRQIQTEIGAIVDRISRIHRHATTPAESASTKWSGYQEGVNALDGLASVNAARDVLIRCEMQMHELARQALDVARSGKLDGRTLDGPSLVFVLQTFASQSSEAEAEAMTEEMNLVSRVLQDYTAMQRMLTDTLAVYDPVKLGKPDDNELLAILGIAQNTSLTAATPVPVKDGQPPSRALTPEEKRLIAMFDSHLSRASSTTDQPGHPLERGLELMRPTQAIITGDSPGKFQHYTKEVWSNFATQLANATKLMNQDSQIRMDEIEKLNQAKNRSYDLATKTITSLSDILRSIIN